MTGRIPVVLDCDPGHDDAFAILLAHASEAVDLRAITTVAGNQTLEKVTLNAARICTLAGITEIPISAGAERPLMRPLLVAADVHGESGLEGADFPSPEIALSPEPAVELLRDILRAAADPVTVIATGPLTNVAQLLITYPDVHEAIKEVVLMGGSTGRGNTTPYAEFNIYVDPEAATTVFSSGLPVTMVGLDVTHQALATEPVRSRIAALDFPLASTCADLLGFFASTYEQLWGLTAPPLHDPVAVARVIDPALVNCVPASVVVETVGEYTRGATVVDLYHRTGRPPNAQVAMDLDVEAFWDHMIGAIDAHR